MTQQEKQKYKENEVYIISLAQTGLTETEIRKKIREVFKVGKSQGERIFNRLFQNLFGFKKDSPKQPATKVEIKTEEAEFKTKGQDGVAESSSQNIRTLDDLVRICQIDLNEWKAERVTSNVYGENFQIKAEFKRKVDLSLKKILTEVREDIKKYSPKVGPIHTKSVDNNDLMFECVLADVHLGRLCWAPSDGDNYNLKIARDEVFRAVHDLAEKAKRFGKYAKVLLWIAGDYLNVDNEENTTTGFTAQSVDSRFPKVFKEGKDILIEVINYLKEIAPVDVMVTRGNHDLNSMFHMGEVIEAYFHNDANVTVNNEPAPRKYFKFGQNLILFTHGDKIDLKKLPQVAAAECTDWSSCKYRELHTAHRHHEQLVVSEGSGCKLRVMNTLAGNDYYHSTHGYVKNIRCAQGFIWNKDHGLQSMVYSKAIEQD